MLNSKYFGSRPGNGPNYQVTNGKFARFPINPMNPEVWATFEKYLTFTEGSFIDFNGTTLSGTNRHKRTNNSNLFVTRYASWQYDPVNGTCMNFPLDVLPWAGIAKPTLCTQSDSLGSIFWFLCSHVSNELAFSCTHAHCYLLLVLTILRFRHHWLGSPHLFRATLCPHYISNPI